MLDSIFTIAFIKDGELWTSLTDHHNDPWVTQGDDDNNKQPNKSGGEGQCYLFTIRVATEFMQALWEHECKR